jgi:hypothetical protein
VPIYIDPRLERELAEHAAVDERNGADEDRTAAESAAEPEPVQPSTT